MHPLPPGAYSVSELASRMIIHVAYGSDSFQAFETTGKRKK
jgi:hypothetical protein